MVWATPQFSKRRVDKAGRTLMDGDGSWEDIEVAREILSNWRAAHAFPLNTFQMALRYKSGEILKQCLVAQRLKRTPSIVAKLQRYTSMKLSRMQDIGGCRSVLTNIQQVMQVRESFTVGRFAHVLVNEKDYILNPKVSGYRGHHLVYRYRSRRNDTYNGLLVEIQLRSRLQHDWATAVETASTFLNQSLKASEGPEKWLEFFALASSFFALIEGTPTVSGTPAGKSELVAEIRRLASDLEVEKKLRAYQTAVQIPTIAGSVPAYYYLLKLMPQQEKLRYWMYAKGALSDAVEEYLQQESALDPNSGDEVVLVAAESLKALRRAYPNYFANTTSFWTQLRKGLDDL